MLLSDLKKKIPRFFEPSLPAVACEVTRQYCSLVRVSGRTPPEVERFAVEPVPAGLVNPSLTRPIIDSPPDFLEVVKSAFAKADIKVNRISLAIPDGSAKVSISHFDTLPGNEDEKIQLFKWKLKKTVPFNIEDSHLAYLEQRGTDGKQVILTVNIHKEVLDQIEGLFEGLGIHVGYITLASFAAFELVRRQDPELQEKSVLFLKVRPFNVSSLIAQKGAVVFFRNIDRESGATSGAVNAASGDIGTPEISLYDEIHPSLMYYQDKLGSSTMDRIYISQLDDPDSEALASLSERSGSPVSSLDVSNLFQWRSSASLKNIGSALIPALGLAIGKS